MTARKLGVASQTTTAYNTDEARRPGISQIAIIHSNQRRKTAPNFVCLLLSLIKPMSTTSPSYPSSGSSSSSFGSRNAIHQLLLHKSGARRRDYFAGVDDGDKSSLVAHHYTRPTSTLSVVAAT